MNIGAALRRDAVPVIVPTAIVAVLGFQRRWVAEDGFITLRVVKQIVAGNGPVFNARERVEASTSVLWTWMLAVADVVTPFRLEWIAVMGGLLFTLCGVVWLARYAMVLFDAAWAEPEVDGATEAAVRVTRIPVGLLALAGLAPFWDYTTSGLESGLCIGWIGACAVVLARRPRSPRGVMLGAALMGLGPLIRPEFALYSLVFVPAFVLIIGTRAAEVVRVVVCAVALPLAYEVFRAGFYAALVPNTALAKEAARFLPERGMAYLRDFSGTYWIVVPVAVAACIEVWLYRRCRDRAVRVALVALPLAGAIHIVYLVMIGGDYMHGRLLLSGVTAILAPVAVLAVPRSSIGADARPAPVGTVPLATVLFGAGALVVAVWSVLVGLHARSTPAGNDAFRFLDEHAHMLWVSGRSNPILIEDYRRSTSFDTVRQVRRGFASAANPAGPTVVVSDALDQRVLAGRPGVGHVAVVRFIGVIGYALGTRIHVVDLLSLADPIGSRIELNAPGFTAGHEKSQPADWPVGRFASPSLADPSAVITARHRLGCPAPAQLLASIEEPLSVGRFVRNLGRAWSQTTLRVGTLTHLFACGVNR